MKYDLRAMFRSLFLLWVAVLAIALVNHFTLGHESDDMLPTLLINVLPILLYAGVVTAMVVLATVFVIQRFYNGLLRDEGYLMFTLPVKAWQLVVSKALSAIVVLLVSALVGVASGFLLVPGSDLTERFWELADVLFNQGALGTQAQTAALVAGYILLAIVSIAAEVYEIYASIAIGHLFSKHRVAMAVLAYLVISLVLMVVTMVLGDALFGGSGMFGTSVISWAFSSGNDLPVAAADILGVNLAFNTVKLVIFHIVTERILSKRLNLE